MKVEVKVPNMGESITQAKVGKILKTTGAFVKEDDELIELETEKVNQVIFATASGAITWSVKLEQMVAVGEVIGYIDKEAPRQESGKLEPHAKMAIEVPQNKSTQETPSRVSKSDYLKELSIETGKIVPEKPSFTPAKESATQGTTRKKLSSLRKAIGERLVKSLHETASLTTFNEVDMSQILAIREKYKDDFFKKHEAKLGFMSFFIKAAVSALKAFPDVNAFIEGDEIVYRGSFDISVAVGMDKGVMVPVIKGCDHLSFAEVEAALEEYAKKSRGAGLLPSDLVGGGFTITNGGIYGSLLSTPILNMPQTAILGMHKIEKRAVVIDDAIVIRPMMYLALSYDHRLIDGQQAVSFLVHIKKMLEDPARLLIDL